MTENIDEQDDINRNFDIDLDIDYPLSTFPRFQTIDMKFRIQKPDIDIPDIKSYFITGLSKKKKAKYSNMLKTRSKKMKKQIYVLIFTLIVIIIIAISLLLRSGPIYDIVKSLNINQELSDEIYADTMLISLEFFFIYALIVVFLMIRTSGSLQVNEMDSFLSQKDNFSRFSKKVTEKNLFGNEEEIDYLIAISDDWNPRELFNYLSRSFKETLNDFLWFMIPITAFIILISSKSTTDTPAIGDFVNSILVSTSMLLVICALISLIFYYPSVKPFLRMITLKKSLIYFYERKIDLIKGMMKENKSKADIVVLLVKYNEFEEKIRVLEDIGFVSTAKWISGIILPVATIIVSNINVIL